MPGIDTSSWVRVPNEGDQVAGAGRTQALTGCVRIGRVRPVGLPLLHEDEVEGIVSSVYADIRRRIPFVPALFKALAAEPETLVAAWLQARAILDDPRSPAAAAAIREAALVRLDYRPSGRIREAVAPYLAELPSMLLIVTSLRLSLDGALERRPAPALDLPTEAHVPEPEFPDRGEHPLFPEICAVYGTRHLPSIFRTLAAGGALEEIWAALGPFLDSPAGAEAVARVDREADGRARSLPEVASFDVESARPVLEQLARALPRNLLVAAAGARASER